MSCNVYIWNFEIAESRRQPTALRRPTDTCAKWKKKAEQREPRKKALNGLDAHLAVTARSCVLQFRNSRFYAHFEVCLDAAIINEYYFKSLEKKARLRQIFKLVRSKKKHTCASIAAPAARHSAILLERQI